MIDETGRITGYKTSAGADTVFPFSSAPEYIATVDLAYSTNPSQRHNLTITADMAKYKTLIISAITSVDGTTAEKLSGTGNIVSSEVTTAPFGNGTVCLLHIVVANPGTDTVISFVHYGTGFGKAIVYGL